jgi:hypothetical protein
MIIPTVNASLLQFLNDGILDLSRLYHHSHKSCQASVPVYISFFINSCLVKQTTGEWISSDKCLIELRHDVIVPDVILLKISSQSVGFFDESGIT